ncbi:MAG: oligoendopeptidase F [Thermomicrobiales bacterium]
MSTAIAEPITRDQIPVEETWNLADYYASDDAWSAAADALPALVETAASYRGRLTESASTLREGLDAVMAAQEAMSRLFVYAKLRLDEDITNTTRQAMRQRAVRIATEAGAALAFIEPEILAADAETVAGFMASDELSGYRFLLEDLERSRAHTRSIEVEELLAQSAEISRAAEEIFDALDDGDIDFGQVKDEDGNLVKLTKAMHSRLMESKNRDVRRGSWNQFMSLYQAHKETLAAAHAASVRKDVFYARVRNYESARDGALHGDNIPGSVYDSLIEAVRANSQVMQKYASLRKRMLGLDSLAMYDTYVPLSIEPDRSYDYPEACEMTLEGVAPLGEQYVNDLRDGFANRWVDVRESKGKTSGAYSWGAYGVHPVILMNWAGTLDTVFTLAHEAGHAMHSKLAQAAQPYHYAGYSIFTAEIASTVNEVLLTWNLLDKLPEDDYQTRFSIINRLVDGIQGTLVRQTQFAEFERETHAHYEAGNPLTLDWMSDLYSGLQAVYVPDTEIDEAVSLTWARVPHFYRAFYVFKYATGISSALAIARMIRDEGEPAAQRYLAMLEAGGSDYPLTLLQQAGVDLTTPAPVTAAMEEYGRLVDELESIALKSGWITA